MESSSRDNERHRRADRTRSWLRRLGYTAATLVLAAGIAATSGGMYLRAEIDRITAGLPVTPDLATLAVSTAVVDRNGLLLRAFTADGGRWRLPVTLARGRQAASSKC